MDSGYWSVAMMSLATDGWCICEYNPSMGVLDGLPTLLSNNTSVDNYTAMTAEIQYFYCIVPSFQN